MCFGNCGLKEIVIPNSVRSIGGLAFINCSSLSSLRFENGSRIEHVGDSAFHGTELTRDNVQYPPTLRTSGYEWC